MIYVGLKDACTTCEDIAAKLPASQVEYINESHPALSYVRKCAAFVLDELIKAHAPELIPYEVAHTELGRPYIVGAENVDISISHAGKDCVAVALCVGEGARVGIDIEDIKNANLRVAEKYFTKEENEYLSSLKEKDASTCFTKLWTRYESKAKYLGGGLADMRKDANVYIYTTTLEKELGSEYALSVCSTKEDSVKIKIF